MTDQSDNSTANLHDYREYLVILATRQMDGRLRGKVDPSDIVQQALLNAHAARNEFRGDSEAERLGWLRRILQTTLGMMVRRYSQQCRDTVLERSLERRLSQSSARLESWLASDLSTPSYRAGRNEMLVHVGAALLKLPESQRHAIELHHLHELTFAEIAEQMKRSKASVAGLIVRGMIALRQDLQHLMEEPKNE